MQSRGHSAAFANLRISAQEPLFWGTAPKKGCVVSRSEDYSGSMKFGCPVWPSDSAAQEWAPRLRTLLTRSDGSISRLRRREPGYLSADSIPFTAALGSFHQLPQIHPPDADADPGLCQPPSEAMIASASFGPQLPRR